MACGLWPADRSQAKSWPQPSASVSGEPLDFDKQHRSAPTVPPIREKEPSMPIISSGHEMIGYPSCKPILIIPDSTRFNSAGQPRSTANTAKQVKFATVDEIASDSDDELPSHKNLLHSLIARRTNSGKAPEYKARIGESDAAADRNNSVDHTAAQKCANSEGRREKGNPGCARFTFDDVLESADMMI